MTTHLRGGRYPWSRPPVGSEAPYRDALALKVGGWIEVVVPFGRCDVATPTDVFEVEPISRWQSGVRQALAYGAATGLRANVALFGPASRERQLKIYMQIRDRSGAMPMRLWLHCADMGWRLITNRREAQRSRTWRSLSP